MTKSKKTMRALLSSAMALLLCFSMLLGTTFAWFTDSASTGVNKIQAGNLKIALEMKDEDGQWKSVNGKTIDFVKPEGHESETILWEPGCSYYTEDFRIVNNGNLALKFKIAVSDLGGDAKLNEVIEWGILGARDNESYDPNAELSFPYTWSWKNTAGEESYSPLNDEFVLLPDEHVYMQLIAEMDQNAGNEYQGLSIDNIAITVLATQWTHEYDSTSNKYDEDAEYPYPIEVSSVSEFLEDAVTVEGNTYTLKNDIQYNSISAENQLFITNADENIIFDGDGHTINVKGANPENGNHSYVSFNATNAKVKDLTITGTGFVELGDYSKQGGTYTAENLVLKNMVSTMSSKDKGNTLGLTFMQYGTATLNNCTMTGATAMNSAATPVDVGFGNGTTTTVNGGKYGVIYCWSHSVATINNAEVDYIYAAPIKGTLTIASGTHVGTINVDYGTANAYATKENCKKLVIEAGATVDSIIYGENTYTLDSWNAFLAD